MSFLVGSKRWLKQHVIAAFSEWRLGIFVEKHEQLIQLFFGLTFFGMKCDVRTPFRLGESVAGVGLLPASWRLWIIGGHGKSFFAQQRYSPELPFTAGLRRHRRDEGWPVFWGEIIA